MEGSNEAPWGSPEAASVFASPSGSDAEIVNVIAEPGVPVWGPGTERLGALLPAEPGATETLTLVE